MDVMAVYKVSADHAEFLSTGAGKGQDQVKVYGGRPRLAETS